ncbi:hypothetical protein pVco5_073 [Vibrio phage pVco-5]|uniref:Uncharacterized protein n=1 Tax=Vibrio phage pVco-5 TaxID=1965485 RepID=A0A1W6JUW5_9CAUD|nr:hypothetical protein KNT61_gp073 [Vibrio phage pVco-5]ARM71061.1 hypothetical protein pVco5_073 [Vibrio phage pVco-5]
METIMHWLEIALVVIGSCSVIVAALKPVAALTETKKDDAVLAKVDSVLNVFIKVLDKLSVNTKPKK